MIASLTALAGLTPSLAAGMGLLMLVHGDAYWIQSDPRYMGTDGLHCCGVEDCRPARKGEVVAFESGYVITSTGQVVRPDRNRGIYTSIDERFWLCFWKGHVRCMFVPNLTQ